MNFKCKQVKANLCVPGLILESCSVGSPIMTSSASKEVVTLNWHRRPVKFKLKIPCVKVKAKVDSD